MTATQRPQNEERDTDPPSAPPSGSAIFREAAAVPSARQSAEPGMTLRGRPRSVEGDEAYHRSVLEQAAIDIAAGW